MSKTHSGRRRSGAKQKTPFRPKAKVSSDYSGQVTEDDNEQVANTAVKTAKVHGIRLQKLLADRGYGSRRKMEGWIKQGKIEVNGLVAELGQRVIARDKVKVNGFGLREKPSLGPSFSHTRVLMYNKPEGEICTTNDPRRRPTVFRNLPKLRGARWVCIGRLDINTAGLLLFTTNGELANHLMHPSSGIEREYRCRIFGHIDKATIQQLSSGIEIDKHTMSFGSIKVENIDADQRNKWVHVTLQEGRNREVRKLWEAVGCQVSRLTRVRYGFLSLPRNLRQGKFRALTSRETKRLLEQGKD